MSPPSSDVWMTRKGGREETAYKPVMVSMTTRIAFEELREVETLTHGIEA
jgi:hypothetical protein